MVVLAVTWMAKVGREAEVAALFEKLTEHPAKNRAAPCTRSTGTRPNRAASSSTSSIKMTPRSKPIGRLRTFCNTRRRTCPRSRTAWKATVRTARVACGAGPSPRVSFRKDYCGFFSSEAVRLRASRPLAIDNALRSTIAATNDFGATLLYPYRRTSSV